MPGAAPGSRSSPFAITNQVASIDPVMRSGAKPGDTLYVTGQLGGSLLGRHLTFEPRVREAKAIAALSHPHIVPIYSSGKENNHYYFAMAYIDGESLESYLKRKRRLPLRETPGGCVRWCDPMWHVSPASYPTIYVPGMSFA